MIFAGIGSRLTPPHILEQMKSIAELLYRKGYILRSGGADGVDSAFESQYLDHKEIFYAGDATPEGIEMASQFHPAWNRCNEYARKLHGRNSMIILGENLDSPVDFVVAWTKKGQFVGGTGLGLRIAYKNEIPIYNLCFEDDYKRLIEMIESQ